MDQPRTATGQKPPARRVGRPANPTDVIDETQIVARGLAACAELGYEGASVREPARRLGVSHNFIHDWYGSKALFWRAIIDRALGAQVARLGAVLNVPAEDPLGRLRNLVQAFHAANVAEPDLARILQFESIRGGERLEAVFQHYLVPVREAVVPLVQELVAQGRVRPIPIDVMVYAVVAMNSVNAEVPFVSLLGDTFTTDSRGFARMLGDIVLDGLVVDPTS